jgi:hypothetical protein
MVMRYVVKKIFVWLETHKRKVLAHQRYDANCVEEIYHDLHNAIKYTVVLGVVYRIVHFFPFLAQVSHIFLTVLVGYVVYVLSALVKDIYHLKRSHYRTQKE